MIEYNENITNGFGILPYILSKALTPDCFICGIPYRYGYRSYIDILSEGMSGRFGYGIDIAHLSNVEFDAPTMFNFQSESIVHTTFENVSRQIVDNCVESNIPVINLLIENEVESLAEILANNIREHSDVTSIV
jgi:hypothetical protein